MRFFRLLVVLTLALAAGTALAGNPPDPTQTHVAPTGRAPCGIAARAGSIWIGVYETGKLLKLDDRDGRPHASVPIGRGACRVAVGPAAAWVTRDRAGELVRVWRGTRRVRRVKVGAGAFDVALAFGSAWVTSFETGIVARVDPRTIKLTRAYRGGANPAGIAQCRGSIWVGHGRDATWLTRIDPESHSVRRVEVEAKAPGWPRCVFGELWVTTPTGALRMDARTGRVLQRLHLGGTPAEAAAGPDGLVWITDKERSLIHRVDAADGVVVNSFAAGPGAYALARVESAMWVTSFAGSDARRYDP